MFLDEKWEGHDDARTIESRRRQSEGRRRYRRLRGVDWLLAPGREPPVGAHIVALRRGYTHHGIYIGAGKVVHYAGLARGLRRGPVEEISIIGFAGGYPVGVVCTAPPKFDGQEIVRRARSRVGEDCYHLLTNNCEHFCEWCVRGQARSYQVEAWFAYPARVQLQALVRWVANLLAPVGRPALRPVTAAFTSTC
jgi:Lecithin retinol acyltransferase